MVTQTAQTNGEFWEMFKSLGDSLSGFLKGDLSGYREDPGWYNRQFAALLQVGSDSERARLIGAILAGDSLGEHIENTINPDLFGRRHDLRYFYPREYTPSSVEEQVKLLLNYYSWLDTSHVSEIAEGLEVPEGADGLYVVPKPSAVANHFNISTWDSFWDLTLRGPLTALSNQRKFKDYKMEGYQLRESARSVLIKLESEQPGDINVFPAQTGKLFAGFSMRNARWEIEHSDSQWPLPTYVVAWMLYANPHRLREGDYLYIECTGDEFLKSTGGVSDVVLYFACVRDLSIASRSSTDPHTFIGSASGFGRKVFRLRP